MAVKIHNPDSLPAIVYDRVFMNNLSISQTNLELDNTDPIYSLVLEYTVFGVDQETKRRYYKPKRRIINIDNYLSVALAKAKTTGDMDLLIAIEAIENAVAKIIDDQTELVTTKV